MSIESASYDKKESIFARAISGGKRSGAMGRERTHRKDRYSIRYRYTEAMLAPRTPTKDKKREEPRRKDRQKQKKKQVKKGEQILKVREKGKRNQRNHILF